MPHPLVKQLRFARSEFARCLEGISDEDAPQQFGHPDLPYLVGGMPDVLFFEEK